MPSSAPLLGNLLNGVSAKRLLILPDGPLNGLPFAALPMPHGQPRELLIDRFVHHLRAIAGAGDAAAVPTRCRSRCGSR